MERNLLLKLSVALSEQESRTLLRIVVAFATAHGFVVEIQEGTIELCGVGLPVQNICRIIQIR